MSDKIDSIKNAVNDNQMTVKEAMDRLQAVRKNIIMRHVCDPLPADELELLEKTVRTEIEIITQIPTMLLYEMLNDSSPERHIRAFGLVKQRLLDKKHKEGELSLEDRRTLERFHNMEQKFIQKYI